MKKFYLLTFLLCLCPLLGLAQQYIISGKILDEQSQMAVELASVALLRTDSVAVAGAMSNEKGMFRLNARKTGNYIVKVSYIGYLPYFKNVSVTSAKANIDCGNIILKHNDNLLGTATVTATAAKVEQVEDTTMFNAAAYRVPEGSTLEALVKQLPGVEIEDDGTITWNGKKIKEFLVNGKDFFKGQADVALKNLPSDWVSRIKAYDKKSDYAEQTGIDDGEDFPVLDITTKRELDRTWITNTDLSYGTEDRYAGRLFVSRFTDKGRVSAYGAMNNVNDKSFGGKRRWGGGGLSVRKNAGVDFGWRNGKRKREAGRLEIGGNIHYNHTNTNSASRTNSESFYSGTSKSSYRSSINQGLGSSSNLNGSFRLDWNPDTMTNVVFQTSAQMGKGDNTGRSVTATFNDDPFAIEGITSPLDNIWQEHPDSALEAIAVNRNRRITLGDRENKSFNGSLNIVRRLNSKGRNVSLGINGAYGNSENNSYSVSNIFYYENRPNRYQNQFSHSPEENWNYTLRAGYTEPILEHLFAQLDYSYRHKYTDNDRARYNLNELDSLYGEWYDSAHFPEIGTLPPYDVMVAVRDSFNSQFATYKYFDHRINVSLKYSTKAIRATGGVSFNPEKTEMSYERPGQHIDTMIVRKVFTVSPYMQFRYFIDKHNRLEARYRGTSSQPSMTNLLAVVDNAHPLNVSMGNPGLEPSWTNSFDMGFRGYNVDRQQGISVGMNFSKTKNAVSNLLVYDQSTGIRYHRPENINGNWNARTNFMYNTGIGKEKNFTISTNTNVVFNHAVGYVSSFSSGGTSLSDADADADNSDYAYYDEIFNRADVQKNTTKTLGVRERLNFGYRKKWLHVATFGMVNYNHSRSDLKKRNDRDTWNFSYGLNGDLNFDFGLSVSSDIRMNSRRGYPNHSMNTNELLWNAQIAYSFLKKKAATISFQCYDILKELSNVSHRIGPNDRTDSWNNSINSYCMVHFIYKFRYFGGKHKQVGGKGKGKRNNKGNKGKSILLDGVAPEADGTFVE